MSRHCQEHNRSVQMHRRPCHIRGMEEPRARAGGTLDCIYVAGASMVAAFEKDGSHAVSRTMRTIPSLCVLFLPQLAT